MEKDWVQVYSSSKQHKVQIVSALLTEHGINSVVMSNRDSSYHFGEVSLYVNRDDVIKAKQLILKNEM